MLSCFGMRSCPFTPVFYLRAYQFTALKWLKNQTMWHLVVAGQIFDSFVEQPATCVVHVIIYSWERHILGHHVRFSFADPMAPYSVQHLSSLAKLTCTKLSCYILTTMVSNTLLTHRSQWLYRIEWESSWLPLKINSFVSPVGSGNWIAHIWKSRVLFSPH